MKLYKFDCEGRHAPAYGCSQPGNNTGHFIPASEFARLLNNWGASLREGGHGVAQNVASEMYRTCDNIQDLIVMGMKTPAELGGADSEEDGN